MGIKMSKAYYLEPGKNGKVIKIENASKSMKGNLFCSTEICRVRVSYVEGHWRECNESTIRVNPFFRLSSSSKEPHKELCQYNTQGRVNVIARSSKSEILESIENRRYKFNLHIVHDSLKILGSKEWQQTSVTGESRSDKQKTKEYINYGSIPSYLLTTKQIVELRSQIEEQEELSQLIKLKFKTTSIPWKNFYYEIDQFIDCFSYIESKQDKERIHPLCIRGQIWRICQPKGKLKFYSVKLKSQWITDDNSDIKNLPSPEFTICNPEILDSLSEDMDVAIYSICTVRSSPIKEGRRYLNIYGQLHSHNQVCVISSD